MEFFRNHNLTHNRNLIGFHDYDYDYEALYGVITNLMQTSTCRFEAKLRYYVTFQAKFRFYTH